MTKESDHHQDTTVKDLSLIVSYPIRLLDCLKENPTDKSIAIEEGLFSKFFFRIKDFSSQLAFLQLFIHELFHRHFYSVFKMKNTHLIIYLCLKYLKCLNNK